MPLSPKIFKIPLQKKKPQATLLPWTNKQAFIDQKKCGKQISNLSSLPHSCLKTIIPAIWNLREACRRLSPNWDTVLLLLERSKPVMKEHYYNNVLQKSKKWNGIQKRWRLSRSRSFLMVSCCRHTLLLKQNLQNYLCSYFLFILPTLHKALQP